MQNTNKKILQTKKALRNAFSSLIETKSIQDISVSLLCRQANINRTTFYKYYSLPTDILSEYLEEIYEQTIKPESTISSENDIYKTMCNICQFYYENKQLIKVYIEATNDFIPLIQRFFGKNIRNVLEENNLVCFISGGVSAIIYQWSLNDYKQSTAVIAKILTQYIKQLYSNQESKL